MNFTQKVVNRVYAPQRTYIEDIDRPKVFITKVKTRTRRPSGEVGRLFNQHIWSDAKYEVTEWN
ncbi:hypothetical protein [Macrococcus animalis]|uniref:hypothetical protein n=1 Tax=Macrococcus animalis TaxID=3395467 RepID=UPI0039BDF844